MWVLTLHSFETGQWDTCKETLTWYNKEIRKAKRSSWRRYCQINDVPGSARLMKVMAKQATNKVSTIKLPDGKHTQTGKETLKELFRVHFPDSKLIDNFVMDGASRTWTHVDT
jgi:hypothetical protein